MKFNVGDKVRVIGNTETDGYVHTLSIGSIGKIKYAEFNAGNNLYYVMEGSFAQWVFECDLELAEEIKHHRPIVYKIYEELKKHVGKENAIPAKELCEMFEDELMVFDVTKVDYKCADRKLREIMEEIRRSEELEKIPCSCNKGYYMASTKEEAMSAIGRLINAAKNEFKTGYIMLKKLGLEGQMKIKLNEFCGDTYHSLMGEDNESN